jgi:Cu/Ag efflux protein CusF
MKYVNKAMMVVTAMGWALLAATPAAADEPSKATATSSRSVNESVVITKVDRSARTIVVQRDDGSTRTVDVPQEVKAFDTLKPGDHIDIQYKEGLALSMLPPGSKLSSSEKKTMERQRVGSATAGHEVTASAVIIAVDPDANTVTFKGPKGNVRTVTVSDPAMQEKLSSLKPGQVVQLTYTEAVAASIRPSGGSK